VPACYAHIDLFLQHLRDVESFAPVADLHHDVPTVGARRHLEVRHTGVSRRVGERLLQNAIERDLERERDLVRERRRHGEIDGRTGERFVLHHQLLEDRADRTPLELRRPEGADEVADLA